MLKLQISFTLEPVSATPIILEANVSNSKKTELVLSAKQDIMLVMEFAVFIANNLTPQAPLGVVMLLYP